MKNKPALFSNAGLKLFKATDKFFGIITAGYAHPELKSITLYRFLTRIPYGIPAKEQQKFKNAVDTFIAKGKNGDCEDDTYGKEAYRILEHLAKGDESLEPITKKLHYKLLEILFNG
ncbi:MAG: hypothetical protein A2Y25_01455 [Candidatus Melainabacteria bacterium GWF2_37_15]|nr:MAG: hypothetical protein A2Y25_01455 [Candidatus Melainabacteria bacterium GWF2_37_15]